MCDTCKLDPALSKDKYISLVCEAGYLPKPYNTDRKKMIS